ncbi:hypothetical protein [Kitasatospora sp. NPDC057198]|uniref:hypothetical protein n=1 Tax=Kitasatospora sp. NPDC057198 TaxID=3346046 RepID=UPI0036365384
MGRLDELWAEGWMPGGEGLFRADGRCRDAWVDGPDLAEFELGGPFELDGGLPDDPEEEAGSVGLHSRAELPDGAGHLAGGGGAVGSEGFAARFDAAGALVRLLHLADSNEFVRIAVDRPPATFTDNLDRSLVLDLTAPEFAARRPGTPDEQEPGR